MIKKKDFVEIEFIAKVKDTGKVFDTNIKDEAKKANLPEANIKPLIVCIGEGMVVKGFDEALENKETGKEYAVSVEPEKAFGKRNASLVKTLPIKVFLEKEIMPAPGMIFNMDGILTRIAAVSGGRVIVDFNNPLAGKKIEYMFKIKKTVDSAEEKINALVEFFLKLPKESFEIKANGNEAIMKIKDKELAKFITNKAIEPVAKKIRDLAGISLRIEEEKEEKKEEKKEQEESKANEEKKEEKKQEKEEINENSE